MLANTDYMVETLDGQTGILEIKTSNLHAKEKWQDDTIPFNYEMQGRRYMSVMDADFCWFACLFGNNKNDFIMRYLERDLDIEADMIAEEENFWNNHVLAGIEPPYTEDSELVLNSIRRHYGAANKSAPAIIIPASLESALKEILELRTKKQAVDKMGMGCKAVCMAPSQTYKLSYSPRYRTGVNADDLNENVK